MNEDSGGFSLQQLSEQSGLTIRTIRYYIQQGLLAPPIPAGPHTRYEQGHLDRLRMIRHLQQRHLSLAEIRELLASKSDDEVQAALPQESGTLAYIRAALEQSGVKSEAAEPSVTLPRARSHWERLELGEGVELHLRRPTSREMSRKIEKLLEEARRIFEET